jgi:hypothetical protein
MLSVVARLLLFICRYTVSICDIWQITFHLTMAKYLPMLPKNKTVQQQTEKFHLSWYKIMKCQ